MKETAARFYDCTHEVVLLEASDPRFTRSTYNAWCTRVEDVSRPSVCWECWNKEWEKQQ